uniref:Protein grip n=1 Tax=Tetraselmis sp. GSL018 TaxID=582737 RepID=A0A061QX10_9CHLO
MRSTRRSGPTRAPWRRWQRPTTRKRASCGASWISREPSWTGLWRRLRRSRGRSRGHSRRRSAPARRSRSSPPPGTRSAAWRTRSGTRTTRQGHAPPSWRPPQRRRSGSALPEERLASAEGEAARAAEGREATARLAQELEEALGRIKEENSRLTSSLEAAASARDAAPSALNDESLHRLESLMRAVSEADSSVASGAASLIESLAGSVVSTDGSHSARSNPIRNQPNAARIAELEEEVEALRVENEKLVESEAQTSRELAAVMQKWTNTERKAAHFAALETTMEASIGVAEQHAEEAEEALEGLSWRLMSSSDELMAMTSRFERMQAQSSSAALAVSSLMEAVLSGVQPAVEGGSSGDPSCHPETASLQHQVAALQDTLQQEMQERSELEQELTKTKGRLEGAHAAVATAETAERRLRDEVSSLSERINSPVGGPGEGGSMARVGLSDGHPSEEALGKVEGELAAALAELDAVRREAATAWVWENGADGSAPPCGAAEAVAELRRRLEAEAVAAGWRAEELEGRALQLEAELAAFRADEEARGEELQKLLQRADGAEADAAARAREFERRLLEAEAQAETFLSAAEQLREQMQGLEDKLGAELESAEAREEALRAELRAAEEARAAFESGEHRDAVSAQEALRAELQAADQREQELRAELEAKVEELSMMIARQAEQDLSSAAAAECEAAAARVSELERTLEAKEKELSDSKRKFVSVAKKKQAEYNAKAKEDKARIEELEAAVGEAKRRASEAAAAAEEARAHVQMRDKELSRMKEDFAYMEEQVKGAKAQSGETVSQLQAELEAAQKKLSARDYEVSNLKQDLEEATQTCKETEKQLETVRTKARDERDRLTARLEDEVQRLEDAHRQALEEMRADLVAEHETDIAHLKESHEAALTRVRSQLEAVERERDEANEAAVKADASLEEAKAVSRESTEQAEGRAAQLAREAEQAAAQLDQLRKDQEAEREKVKRAMADLKKKAERAERAQRKAETSAAEMRGKNEAEKEALRSENLSVSTQLALAREEVQRVERELREYRARAHALLQRKEAELHSRISGTGSAGDDTESLRDAAREAQAMLKQAMEERDQMARSLEEAEDRWAKEAEELQSAAAAREDELAGQLSSSRAVAERSAHAVEAALEAADARAAHEESSARSLGRVPERPQRASGPDEAPQGSSVRALQAKLDAVTEEFQAFRQTSMEMAEAKDAEVSKLLESNAKLREELVAARAQDGGAPMPRLSDRGDMGGDVAEGSEPHAASEDTPHWHRHEPSWVDTLWGEDAQEWDTFPSDEAEDAGGDIPGGDQRQAPDLLREMLGRGGGGLGDAASQLMQIAQRQAQRDEELTAARRQAAELEDEVSELRKEVQLRDEQERVLKEALRETQRTEAREHTTKNEFDMEYLKNVVVQLVCTRQQEALLPVIAQVLHLSPAETDKCRAALKRYKEEEEGDVLNAATDYISSTATWFGSGWLTGTEK